MIRKIVVITACGALLAPLAFAQSQKKEKTTTATTVTVTGTVITATEEGAAASYQPFKTLVVRQDKANKPGSYALQGPGHVFNKRGELVQNAIHPGTRVRIYYTNAGDVRMIDHLVLID